MSERNFIIRVDSSSEIGMGHLMRCLALADELVKRKSKVIFICRNYIGSGHKLVLEQNFKLHLLTDRGGKVMSSKPSDLLKYTQLLDASESSEIISKYPRAHVIVDHYGLDYNWESNIKCDSIIVIDDLANRPHHCSLLIDQSLKNTKLDYEQLIDGDFDFIGGNMIILREEFTSGLTWLGSGGRKVLICMGGADPYGYTQTILELIATSHKNYFGEQTVVEINVVVGAAFNDIANLKRVIDSSELNISISMDSQKVSELMIQTDLCILSCGTMILEACALGAPSIGIVVAENQQSTADYLERAGAIELFDLKSDKGPDICSVISSLVNNSQRLSFYSSKLKKMVSQKSKEIIVRSLYEC